MKKFFLFILSIGLIVSCKKGQTNFVFEGVVIDATHQQVLAGATVKVYKDMGSEGKQLEQEISSDANGEFHFETKRDQFSSIEIEVSKKSYFTVSKSLLFNDLTVDETIPLIFETTGKSWVSIHVLHQNDPSTVLDMSKSEGKTGCDVCCSDEYQQFVGNVDTFIFCINDANELYEITYFQHNSNVNGTKSVITPFNDTATILLEY